MQPNRDHQSTFFDLAVQQPGPNNHVLETIARVVNFKAVAEGKSPDADQISNLLPLPSTTTLMASAYDNLNP